MAEHLQIHEPVAQPGKGRDQTGQQQHGAADLQFVGHLKSGQPPVPIGSSTNGVTSGGQISFSLRSHCNRGPLGELSRLHAFF